MNLKTPTKISEWLIFIVLQIFVTLIITGIAFSLISSASWGAVGVGVIMLLVMIIGNIFTMTLECMKFGQYLDKINSQRERY
jgi:uncharacterized integral membrane protein